MSQGIFIVNVRQLEKDRVRLYGLVSPAALDISDEDQFSLPEDILYDMEVAMSGGVIVAQGALSTNSHCKCGRCLKEFDLKIDLKDVFHFYEKPVSEEIDLTPDIREDIIMAFPQNIVCNEGCKGLCPICGGDRNIRDCKCKVEEPASEVWNALDGLFK
jgi:uncharacterized metal-binding protein YceD (DUF177 family)